jgi:hypothetical protein
MAVNGASNGTYSCRIIATNCKVFPPLHLFLFKRGSEICKESRFAVVMDFSNKTYFDIVLDSVYLIVVNPRLNGQFFSAIICSIDPHRPFPKPVLALQRLWWLFTRIYDGMVLGLDSRLGGSLISVRQNGPTNPSVC